MSKPVTKEILRSERGSAIEYGQRRSTGRPAEVRRLVELVEVVEVRPVPVSRGDPVAAVVAEVDEEHRQPAGGQRRPRHLEGRVVHGRAPGTRSPG
jgi:hypothetical protein